MFVSSGGVAYLCLVRPQRVTSTRHRIISGSLWSLCTAAVCIYSFAQILQPPTKPIPPDVTPFQIYALPTLFGIAAITGFCFALGLHWAHIVTRVFATVFILFVGFGLIASVPDLPREDFTVAVLSTSVALICFLIGLYACLVSWRTPLDANAV